MGRANGGVRSYERAVTNRPIKKMNKNESVESLKKEIVKPLVELFVQFIEVISKLFELSVV